MKKFLFTLAALLMAGSAFADNYLYIADFEVAEAELGTEIAVPVKAHFDNRVSAFELWITPPEGMEIVDFEAGADMKGMKYYNQRGREGSIDASITTLDNMHFVAITSATTVGYYQDEEGNWVPYLAIKWEPGDYEEMLILYVEVAEDFAGGEVSVRTMPASGEDPRGNTCPKGEDWTYVNNITVEGAVPPVPEVTEKPVITYVDDPEAQTVTVTATGAGHICLYWDDMLQAEGEGTAEWVIPYGDDPEGEEYGISATAQEEGKEISDYALATIFVPGKEVTPPEPKELTGDIVLSEPTEDGIVTVTYTGDEDVTVVVTVNGVEVDGDIELEEGENVIVVTVTAPGYEPMEETFVVEYTPGTPVEPTYEGYWIVLIDKDGNEIPYQLNAGENTDYSTTVSLDYDVFGTFDFYGGAERPVVGFYFIVDDVKYGAPEDMTATVLGTALDNPLSENMNYYTVPVGYSYTLGIFVDDMTNEFYVYAAQGGYTGVNELVNGKTVAGVRYFNMAGQEMQEANGMTIVVTTYTDGTTSAVKVIK